MKNSILKNWNLVRAIRLVLGISIVAIGLWEQQALFVLLGVGFTLMPLLNVGCCTTGDCGLPPVKKCPENKADGVTYEEIK